MKAVEYKNPDYEEVVMTLNTQLIKGQRVFANKSDHLIDEGISYNLAVSARRETKHKKASIGI